MTISPALIGLIGGFAVYFLYIGLHRRAENSATKSALEERLAIFSQQSSFGAEILDEAAAEHERSRRERGDFFARLGQQIIESMAGSASSMSLLQVLHERLVLAGHPKKMQLTDFVGFWVLTTGTATLAGGLLAQAGWLPTGLYVALVGIAAYYPFNILNSAIKERQEQAFAEFPDFLEEIILGMSSGQPSMTGVLSSMLLEDNPIAGQHDRVLAKEFRQALIEFKGQAREFEEAFRAAAARLQVQEVDDLVELMILNYTTGAPILTLLRQTSEHVYKTYEQAMQTLIKKQDTRFTVATIMILFAVGIDVVTPIFLTVVHALGGGLQ